MGHTPEKSSDFVKRVLFDNGGGNHARPIGPGEVATLNAERQGAAGEAQADDGCQRSESHSSMSSAGGALASPPPATPRLASGSTSSVKGASSVSRTPGSSTSNKASLSVFLRVRPPNPIGSDTDHLSGKRTYDILQDSMTIRTFPPRSATHSRTIKRQAKDFGFAKVFGPMASQEEVYDSTMRPLVDDVFASENGLLFAYGMTNAGKTYTVLGEDAHPGLIPQALNDTFTRVGQVDEEDRPRVEMSFLEIYNENVYDLLGAGDESDWATERNGLKLDDRMGVFQARDLSKHVITSASGGLELVRRATANRRMKLVRSNGNASNLWVVDLAGSERNVRTGAGASSTRQKEANNINKGLSTLWHCLTIMRANMRKDEAETRIPFRDSKLTLLFKNHLQGASAGRTVMVVNVNPRVEDFDETQAVLKNSTIARAVRIVRDESAAVRQNGLINTSYGFNGRKTQIKKPAGSRRSIHQPVAPKLEALDPPSPLKAPQSPQGVCREDTDCGSAGEDEEEEEEEDRGYLSGAESDSGLVDTRQSMNLVMKNLKADNDELKAKLKSSMASKMKFSSHSGNGHQPTPGGPLEMYIQGLEDKIVTSELKLQRMQEEHLDELHEMEEELQSFLEENGLTGKEVADSSSDNKIHSITIERLMEEVRVAKLESEQWKKEAETLRSRMEGIESRLSPPSAGVQGGLGRSSSSSRSPLRPSLGSASQGRPSVENRQPEADGENSPPAGARTKVGPPPGGVGSPSKKAARLASPPKAKPSELPSKSTRVKKLSKSKSPNKGSSRALANGTMTPSPSAAKSQPKTTSPNENGSASISGTGLASFEPQPTSTSTSMSGSAMLSLSPPQLPSLLPDGSAGQSRTAVDAWTSSSSFEQQHVAGEDVCTGDVRLSGGAASVVTHAGEASPAVESSNGVGSPASFGGSSRLYSPGESTDGSGKGKVVVAMSRRVSVLRASTAGGGRTSRRSSVAGQRRMSRASVAGKRVSQLRTRTSVTVAMEVTGDATASREGSGGPSSRRESAIMLENNFFEKARRVLLRAMGVGAGKGGVGGRDSLSGGMSLAPASAAEIEAKHKIKVKMPKRPGKKGMEGTGGSLFGVEDEDDDEEEVILSNPPAENPNSNRVVNGIERWVFGAGHKDERVKRSKSQKEFGNVTPSSVSPVRNGDAQSKTFNDYVRAM